MEGPRRIKRDGRCARFTSSSPFSLTHSSLSFSLSLSLCPPPSFLSFFSSVPPTPSLNLPLYLSLSLSLPLDPSSPSLSSPSRPSDARSFSLPPPSIPSTLLALPHRGRLARARDPCTSAFLSAERRTGFRRKETTIRRIVATDHSWRVDRINGVNSCPRLTASRVTATSATHCTLCALRSFFFRDIGTATRDTPV